MRYLQIINEINDDRSHGAFWLTLRSIDVFNALVEDSWSSSNFHIALEDAYRRLISCRPSMSSIKNVASICFRLLESAHAKRYRAGDVMDALLKLRDYVIESKNRVAENAVKELSWAKSFLTHSLSSTVLEFFKHLNYSKTIVVTESRPLCEGVATARELASMGHKVKLVIDASAYQSSKMFNVDVFVFGADTILRDGRVINKSGTAQIAIAVKSLGVMNVVLSESFKVDPELTPESVHLEVKEPREIINEVIEGVEVFNLYFDLTPSTFIDEVVMESGVFKPPFKLSPPSFDLH
ncbi:MAG: hypothetical protein N3F04_07405 [Candidatus Nezhaarchaeota archaeon]|nr:hypothetical protein [Candidatus Nezhaarchaeota archaeon]MCX8142571.1 hypothetical protein [Candidatus Nezhaarchaeota archaeon]